MLNLYLEGNRVHQIAEIMGLDQGDVGKRLARVRQSWAEARLDAYDEIVARCEATSRHIMALAFQGYRKSQEAETTDTTTTGTEGNSHSHRDHTRPAGNPQFLALAERCNYQIAQINGILDRDARNNAATSEQKSALIEVVVRSPAELKRLQSMDFKELEDEVVHQAGGHDLLIGRDH